MNSPKWQQIKEVFNQAVELDSAAIELLLENQIDPEVVEEVRKLIAAEKSNNFNKPVANLSQIWQEETLESYINKEVGNYKIVREIGFGGMGIVFEAIRQTEDFSQTVALKILKRGMDSDAMLRRFSHERQILASLEHPNIARLVDGGISVEGTPFFAMEFVKGQPIDEYCNEKTSTINQRLRLFLQICSAVSFAHSRLVVHRDLKPNNILVTADGTIKLLDFGIAKLLSPDNNLQNQTVTTLGMMTPAYASPEQIRGEMVSTSSDIYSLGLILYELLTGVSAYDFPNNRPDEMAKIICETEPVRPSSVVSGQLPSGQKNTSESNQHRTFSNNPKSLRGDLDTIVLKALRKEPSRRYASVEQFASDILRHLEGLPVTARPDTFSYRFEKFFKRNRVSVIAASLVLLSLLGGIAATTWQSIQAEKQRQISEQRFNQVRELANNIVFKYYDEAEKMPNSTSFREMLVKDSLNYFDSLAQDKNADDNLKSELALAYIRIGKVSGRAYFANLGDISGAIENYKKGIALLEPLATKSANTKLQSDLINAYSELTNVLRRQGNTTEADELLLKAITLNEDLVQKNPEDIPLSVRLATNYLFLGDSLPVGNKISENIQVYKKSMGVCENILTRDPNHIRSNNIFAASADRVATNLVILAKDAVDDNNADYAKQLFQEAVSIGKRNVEITEKLVLLQPNDVLNVTLLNAAKFNYGTQLFDLGERQKGLQILTKSEQVFRKDYENDKNNLETKLLFSSVMFSVGTSNLRDGNVFVAENLISETLKNFDELIAHDSQNFDYQQKRWEAKFAYADELLLRGEIEKARNIYEKASNEIDKIAHEKKADYGESLRGFYHQKLGNCDLAIAESKNQTFENRRELLQKAIAHYEKTFDLWTQNGVESILGVKQPEKLEVLKRKISRLKL